MKDLLKLLDLSREEILAAIEEINFSEEDAHE